MQIGAEEGGLPRNRPNIAILILSTTRFDGYKGDLQRIFLEYSEEKNLRTSLEYSYQPNPDYCFFGLNKRFRLFFDTLSCFVRVGQN